MTQTEENVMKKALAERCCEKDLEAIRVKEFDANELYYIDKNGRWQETTPEEIRDIIGRDGEANVVLKCDTVSMNKYGIEMDSGYQEFDAVKDFYCEDGMLLIETEHEFLCNEDISREIGEYEFAQLNYDPNMDFEMNGNNEIEIDWDDNIDLHNFGSNHSSFDEVDFEFDRDM